MSDIADVISYKDTQWRDSGLMARFGLVVVSIDARAFLPLVALMFHLSYWTLGFFVFAVTTFSILEYFGYNVPVALRKGRSFIAGPTRFTQRTISRKRRMIHG